MSDASELAGAIDTSRLYHSCIARHFFRFAESRVEVPEVDGCLLSKMEAAARNNEPLSHVLKVIAEDPTFKARRFD
jgi:hypothetical protein